MNWSVPKVIGHNARKRRGELGISATVLGEKLGEILGKSWPRQTVSLMENGERAMIAIEVVALAEVLDVPVLSLFTPPADPTDSVLIGEHEVNTAVLTLNSLDESERLMNVAKVIRALDGVRAEIGSLATQTMILVDDARKHIQGLPLAEPPAGEKFLDEVLRQSYEDARSRYDFQPQELDDLDDVLNNSEGEDNGEGN